MRLLSLRLRNFKGIPDFLFGPGGRNTDIIGDNGAGKTTIADAYHWLLSDKDSQGKKDFDIKTLDAENNVIHHLEHEVEGVFDDVMGHKRTLRKRYVEDWTKKRGSLTTELTGHKTKYWIDGVTVKRNQYIAFIASIADEEKFRLLTNPTYFNDDKLYHWTKRRRTVLDISGDVPDDEVIASSKNLAALPGILKGRKLDDHRKAINERQATIKKQADEIPNRIDEVNRGLPDITGIDQGSINQELQSKMGTLKQKQQELLQLEAGGAVAQQKNKLAEIEAEIQRMQTAHQAKVDKAASTERNALEGAVSKRNLITQEITHVENCINSNQRQIDILNGKREALRKKFFCIRDEQPELKQDAVCPTCGQELPKEKLAEAWVAAINRFNLDKAERLENIQTEGKAYKADVEELEKQNAGHQAKLTDLKAQLVEAEQEVAQLREGINANPDIPALEQNPEYAKLQQKKAALQSALLNAQQGSNSAVESLQNEIAQIEVSIKALEADLKKIEDREKSQKRIDELKDQEKKLNAEFERLSGELYLTDQFIKAKVKMLDQKINTRFKFARFKMFDVQVNGGIDDCCETIFGGVPYGSGLNRGAQNFVGLDIINTLSDHYGFYPPIFIDNSESITKLPETKAQVIRLVVAKQAMCNDCNRIFVYTSDELPAKCPYCECENLSEYKNLRVEVQ